MPTLTVWVLAVELLRPEGSCALKPHPAAHPGLALAGASGSFLARNAFHSLALLMCSEAQVCCSVSRPGAVLGKPGADGQTGLRACELFCLLLDFVLSLQSSLITKTLRHCLENKAAKQFVQAGVFPLGSQAECGA